MEKINNCKSCNSSKLNKFLKDINSFGFNMDVIQCDDCGLRFRNIELNSSEINDLYSEKYFSQEQRDYFFNSNDIKVKIFSNRLKMVNEIISNKGKILDVGSAIGTFLELAKKDGWEETGIEISKFASDYAKNRGLNSINGDISTIRNLDKKFDIITLWDVIDHAERPLNLLKVVHSLLKQGGYIFVETTVIDSSIFLLAELLYRLSFRLIKAPLQKGYPVHHSNYYSQKTMGNDIEEAGFKIVKIVRETFNHEIFSGEKIGKYLFVIAEWFSKIIHKEIVCTIIAKAD